MIKPLYRKKTAGENPARFQARVHCYRVSLFILSPIEEMLTTGQIQQKFPDLAVGSGDLSLRRGICRGVLLLRYEMCWNRGNNAEQRMEIAGRKNGVTGETKGTNKHNAKKVRFE